MNSPETNPLLSFSERIADLVAGIGASVAAVHIGRHESTGAIAWRDGVLVTVAHALRQAREPVVTLPGGETVKARVAGIDGSTDLAALRIEAASPSPAPRSTHPARTGHLVFAVTRGTHGDLLVDHGLIGRTGGEWQTWRGGRIDRLIRLDGGLPSGFSGAPVVAADGGVIGIGTSALARSHGVVVPAETVDRVVDQLLAHGRVTRGFLGIGAQPVTLPDALTRELQLENERGLLIASIADDGPAEKAGLLIGDILLALDQRPTEDIDQLHTVLGAHAVGAEIAADLLRGGRRMQTALTVGERPRAQC